MSSLESIVILTGQSGSGKSTAIRALEDEGFLCVDNLPASLAEQLVETVRKEALSNQLTLGMDIRSRRLLQDLPGVIDALRQGPCPVRLVYLEAQVDSLIRRYSETRRRHPLDTGQGLRAAIAEEQVLLASLREQADDTIDTTGLTPHKLRHRIAERIAGVRVGDGLRVALLSFGFKYGLPLEADVVFDVRFLKNPYFESSMRSLTGLHPTVHDYVLGCASAGAFLEHAVAMLSFLIPQYQAEGRHYLTVAVGCTGGQHRSVAIAQELGARLPRSGGSVDVRHRDAERVSEDSELSASGKRCADQGNTPLAADPQQRDRKSVLTPSEEETS